LSPMVNTGDTDIFVAKLDPNGNGLWSKQVGYSTYGGSPAATSLSVDSSGNVLVTGKVLRSVDFGIFLPGTTTSSYDVFVVKYSGAAGSLLWAKRTSGDGVDCGQGVAVKPNGNAVVAGFFSDAVDFGGGTLSGPAYEDAFLVELGP